MTVRRREFIASFAATAAWPLAARAQQRTRRVGVLVTALPPDDPDWQRRETAFVQALAQLGWTDGRNIHIDYRFGLGDPARLRKSAAELVALLGMEEFADRRARGFSQGERIKTALARALVHSPRNLLLDEPTAFLDPQAALQVRGILLRAQRERETTILYTSHNMAEVEELCKLIVFLNRGRLIATGSPIARNEPNTISSTSIAAPTPMPLSGPP